MSSNPSQRSAEAQSPSQTLTGSCHCQSVRYTATVSPPLAERKVTSCNCSYCKINGLLLIYINPTDLTFEESSKEKLKSYQFASRKVRHLFCAECGTNVMCESVDQSLLGDKIVLNVRPLKGVDLDKLSLQLMDGANMNL